MFSRTVSFSASFLVHCIWQVVDSLKAKLDSGTLMESEVPAVSIVHFQQDSLAELRSDSEFSATVFGFAPQVEKLKHLLQNKMFQKLNDWKKTDTRLKFDNFKELCLKGMWADYFTFFVLGRCLGESIPESSCAVLGFADHPECRIESARWRNIRGTFQQRCLDGGRGARALVSAQRHCD